MGSTPQPSVGSGAGKATGTSSAMATSEAGAAMGTAFGVGVRARSPVGRTVSARFPGRALTAAAAPAACRAFATRVRQGRPASRASSRQVGRLDRADAVKQLGRIVPGEWRAAGQEIVECRAETVDVAAMIVVRAIDPFRRQIDERRGIGLDLRRRRPSGTSPTSARRTTASAPGGVARFHPPRSSR